MAASTVLIDVKAVDKASPTLNNVAKTASGLNKTILGVTAGFIGFNVAVSGLKSSLDGTIGAAIRFESSFAGIRKTVDATEAEFSQLERANRNLAKSLPVSVNEINRIGEAAGALGITGVDNIASFEKTIAALAVTTNLTADEAATAFGKIRTALDIPVDDLDNLASAIVDLGNKGASTESEIVEFLNRIAGAGKLIGVGTADLAGIASAFASLGVEAEAGGSAVQRVFLGMASAAAKGGTELDVFAAVLGTSVEGFKEALKTDPTETFLRFVEGLGAAGDQSIQVLDALGLADVRLESAFLKAAGAGGELRRQIDVSTEAYAANTALTIELATRTGTTASQFQILKNHIHDFGITIGREVNPALNSLLVAVNASFEPLGKAATATADFVATVREAAGPFDDLALAILSIVNPLTLLAVNWAALGNAVTPAVNAVLAAGTAIVNAVGGILNAGASLVGGWSNIWQEVSRIVGAAKDTIVSILQAIADAVVSVGSFIDGFIGKINGIGGKLGGLLGAAGIELPELPTLGLKAPQLGGGGGESSASLAETAFVLGDLTKTIAATGEAAAVVTPNFDNLNAVLAGLNGGGGGGGGGVPETTQSMLALADAFAKSGMTAEEFTARLQLAEEAGALEKQTAEEAFQGRVDLLKMAITLKNAGIDTLGFFERLVSNTLPDLGAEMVRVIAQAIQSAGAASAEEVEQLAKRLATSMGSAIELSARKLGANVQELLNFDVTKAAPGQSGGVRASTGGVLTDAGLKKVTMGLVQLAAAAGGAVPSIEDLLNSVIHVADVGKSINSLNEFFLQDPTENIAEWEQQFRKFYQMIVEEFGVEVADQMGKDFDSTALKLDSFYKSIQATGSAAEANAASLRKLAEAFEKSGMEVGKFSATLALKIGDALSADSLKKLFISKSKAGTLPDFGPGGVRLPKFHEGTPYVPRTMIAEVQKGEAIIPASENRRGTTLNNYGRISVNAGSVGTLARELAVNLR